MNEENARIEQLLRFQCVQLYQLEMAMANAMLVSVSDRERRTARFQELAKKIAESTKDSQKTLLQFLKALDQEGLDVAEIETAMILAQSLSVPREAQHEPRSTPRRSGWLAKRDTEDLPPRELDRSFECVAVLSRQQADVLACNAIESIERAGDPRRPPPAPSAA